MIPDEQNITPLVSHPGWHALARYFLALERTEIDRLKTAKDEDANLRLIFLTRIKVELRQRSENKELWNVRDP